MTERVRPVVAAVSSFGWAVLVSGLVSVWLGLHFGWVELSMIGTASIVLFACCAMFTIGRAYLTVEVQLDPQRVVVGDTGAGQIEVTNLGSRPRLPIALELPIGRSSARFMLPVLRPGARHDELFVVPTDRRGVVPVGPAQTVQGDPLGLVRRARPWGQQIEMFVHPRTVPLESLGTGLLRDLEGLPTTDISMSDLAFHALREYQPGDDRRYIHWRSSAKMSGRSDGGGADFLVRQFLDTRRSHIATIVDSDEATFPDPEDYETAISAAASIAIRAVLDEQDITVVAGGHSTPSASGRRVLDTFARAELGRDGLSAAAARARRLSPDISIALMFTGARVPYGELRRAASHFPTETRSVVVRIDPETRTGISDSGRLAILNLRTLVELPQLLSGVLQ